MAGQVVSAVLARAAGLDASGLLTQFRHDGGGFVPRSTAVAVDERPPMDTVRRVPLALGRDGRLTHAGESTGRVASRPSSPDRGGSTRAGRSRSAPLTGPEVVAHRGATAEAPEHTLAAYRRAAAIGADAVECDVRMTRDGVLVCVHDRQIAHTSNGRGVVSALHLDELEQFHFGARKSSRSAAGGPTTRSPR